MTADTYSTDGVGVLLMGTGNDNNAWGDNANNSVFQIFLDAITNSLTSSVTGGTLDLSGSPPPAAPSQARYAGLIFTGTLASNQSVKVPNLAKWWLVENATSGAFALTFQTPSGSASSAIPQNSGWQLVYCDGSNNILVFPFNTAQIQMPDGSASAPPFSNVNEPKSGWYRNGTQDWRLAINGLDVLQVTGAGAGSASIVNVLTPNVLQIAGVTITSSQLIQPGFEQSCANVDLPSGGWLWEDGAAYSRTTEANLFAAITKTCTANTHGNTTIDNLSVDLRGKGLEGAFLECTGATLGTTIVSVDSATSLTVSVAISGSNTGLTIRALPWGQGDGSTTFNVPDRRYRTLVGRDNMNNNPAGRSSAFAGTHLNATGGEESHTLTSGEVPNHTHTASQAAHTHVIINTDIGGNSNNLSSSNTLTQTSNIGNSADYALKGTSTAPSLGITSSATPSITVAATTGGGGAHNVMQPFGITNWIIKV